MDSNKVQLLALSQVKVNADNPRTISGEKFQKLINSILVFPKMMELRPVVINSQFVALGGNMRTNALNAIAKMQAQDIASRLEQLRDYQKLTSGEKDALKKYWGAWVKKPTVHAVKADTLSPTEQQQFIVKDNVSFGAWDFDALANKFDERDLGDWGMDIWQPTEFVSSPSAPVGSVPTQQPNYPADSEDDASNFDHLFEDALSSEGKPKPLTIEVVIPQTMEGDVEIIKSEVEGVVSKYQGVIVR